MNILFASEMFPMRNSFTEHSEVVRFFMSCAEELLSSSKNDLANVRILSNNQTIDLVGRDKLSIFPSIIRPSAGFSKKIKESLSEWSVSGLSDWKYYVSNSNQFSKDFYNELDSIYNEVYKFNVIVIWGENGVYKKFASDKGIPCISLELSSTRSPFPDTRFFDLSGANGSASYRNIDIQELKKQISAPDIKFWPALYSVDDESLVSKVGFDDGPLTYWENDVTRKISFLSKGKTALIGLQLYDDANTQLYSEYNSPLHFLEDVLPTLIDADWNVIVKTHPGAIHRPINYIEQKKAIRYASKFENCYVCDEHVDARNYLALLKCVQLVVVINSSLGFESALLGKRVVLQGDASYKIEGVFPTLDEALKDEFDDLKYEENISTLVYFFNKYAFLKSDCLKKVEFYSACKKLWDSSENALKNKKFPLLDFLDGFSKLSNVFLVNKNNLEFSCILKSYVNKDINKGDPIKFNSKAIVLEKNSYLSRIAEYSMKCCIDTASISNNLLVLKGWAFEENKLTPPVLAIVVFGDKVLHVGRVVNARPDVKSAFFLDHDMVGFSYSCTIDEAFNKQESVKVVFVFQDGMSKVLNVK